jgi:penicillin-insensitive murein endopeptidase
MTAIGYAQTPNPWGAAQTPATGAPQALGRYDGGCLRGAAALPVRGAGYRAIRLFRHRHFGHPDLVDFVRSFAEQTARQGLGTLLVGDISQPRGGPPVSGHRSHQTGLDVDIWFESLEEAAREGLDPEALDRRDPASMLKPDGRGLDHRHWHEVRALLLKSAAQYPSVDRIFVNPAIKRALCKRTGERTWLRKLRPWWGHDEHFHVRLACPKASPECIPQDQLPSGDGCDASLDWWFTDEARARQRRALASPPPLPSACSQVLQQ